MLTQNEITALSLSPTKKDFVQIWNELLEVAGKLSERWDVQSQTQLQTLYIQCGKFCIVLCAANSYRQKISAGFLQYVRNIFRLDIHHNRSNGGVRRYGVGGIEHTFQQSPENILPDLRSDLFKCICSDGADDCIECA